MVSGHCEQQECSPQTFCVWKLLKFHLIMFYKYISTKKKKGGGGMTDRQDDRKSLYLKSV